MAQPRERSNLTSNPCRTSRFIEDMPDPLSPQEPSSDLLFDILSQMDEFEQKRKHRASHSSGESWGLSGPGHDNNTSKNSNNQGARWLKSVKSMGFKGKFRGLVKTNGT